MLPIINALILREPWHVIFSLSICGGWTAGAHHHCFVTPLFTGQRRENKMKSLWVEIRSGGDRSPITVIGKAYLTWGNLI